MNEITQRIAKRLQLSDEEVQNVVSIIFEEIESLLVQKEKSHQKQTLSPKEREVLIKNFGSFFIVSRPARQIYIPGTHEQVSTEPIKEIHFRPFLALKERMGLT
ncbi:hypothetical protein CCZ01_05405 [Helicobacter monodelphidis]|uniref:HU family DNA-binding protein n=1 Tax=Helicobacter sp. 15-1451 TaxID=2004995 RepID=UPI000DCE0C4C|nr:HU family DNA-binding protein [Helicobacter sp. 15-1451]RAX57581.1 hypothetical protein CCZ01_05405 [Helicobacter sp. 15-1451]